MVTTDQYLQHLHKDSPSSQRHAQPLQTGWWVSPSAHDAVLAATKAAWEKRDLEYADDMENHPQYIDLPGGPAYGKRPQATDVTGHGTGAAVEPEPRLPSPFLSYAKVVAIPRAYADHTIWLELVDVRYRVIVQVNGQHAGQYVGGLEPNRFDITSLVTPGEDATILITVGDVGVSGKRPFDPYNYTGTRLPACAEITNNLIHPVIYGGIDGRLAEKVTLHALPRIRTAYVFANPKVSRGVLQYTILLVNETDQAQTVHVHSEASEGKVLLNETLSIPAQASKQLYSEIPWPDAIRWDLDHPFLYHLRTTVTDGECLLDVHEDYFGFREFTIDGHCFYLNGKKIHLLGNSGHITPAQNALSLADKIAFLQAWKTQGHLNHLRLHARPWDRSWVEAADRVGMLLTTETALWTTNFISLDWAGDEEGCYQNVRHHFLEALVRRDRNSPSVVIWSLSNEMSPITPWDLENPKMAAMTRVFERIIAEVEAEDDSRILQMSSAMDFLGKLRIYNLHYPKDWQGFPDYPHTAYWLDDGFLFPWYGPARQYLPSWSWRKNKPLYMGEFTCVFGATPDAQACIVGDIAFEDADYGSARVQEKLWPMEVKAYRRQDVSGFCAWSFALGGKTDAHETLQQPEVQAHTAAVRPLAVLDHSYRTRYYSGSEVALELSIHNDTRENMPLALCCEVRQGTRVIWTETMPERLVGPAETLAFTSRFRAPQVEEAVRLQYTATLSAGDQVVDEWTKALEVWPRAQPQPLPARCAFYDPDGVLAARFTAAGIQGAVCLDYLDPAALHQYSTIWLNFDQAKVHTGDWRQLRQALQHFVQEGGCVVLDQPSAVLDDLPIPLQESKGYHEGDHLPITYAFSCAQHHPLMQAFGDADFALWGDDYYVATRCVDTPQEGNALPLLVAGVDRNGLTATPLLEIAYGKGSYLVSYLHLIDKLLEEPKAAHILTAMAAYTPCRPRKHVGACVTSQSWQRLREVGFEGENTELAIACAAELVLLDGACLPADALPGIREALLQGKTIYLHALEVAQTQQVLDACQLPGMAKSGQLAPGAYDVFRHVHPLCNGMTNNYLYWIVDKAKLAPWVTASLHPAPASALIELAPGIEASQLTRRGAVTIYPVGAGMLIIDNLGWQLPELDEPERPRRYLTCLLTNLGVPLTRGMDKRMSQEFETAEERRERGHF